MRDVERQRERERGSEERQDERKRGSRRGWEREREKEKDSWLHHISLAVVECALTVHAASVVVRYPWGGGEATWPPTGAMLRARAGGDARVCTNAESPCGPRGQSRSIPSRLLAEPREHEVMHATATTATTITATTTTVNYRHHRRRWGDGGGISGVAVLRPRRYYEDKLRKGGREAGNLGYHTFLIAISNTFARGLMRERREVGASRGCAAIRNVTTRASQLPECGRDVNGPASWLMLNAKLTRRWPDRHWPILALKRRQCNGDLNVKR